MNGANVSVDDMEKLFPEGQEMDVRVMGYHLIEGIALVSNKKDYLQGTVVHSSQVEVGQIVEVEIRSIEDFGLVVVIGGKVKAICPMTHLTESGKAIQAIKKFKKGQKLTVRIWEADGRAIIVTNKKSIVEFKGDIITSYDTAVEGTVTVGVVSQVSTDGLRIHFFNKVCGRISMSVLVKQGVVDVEDDYHLGQVVRCVLLRKQAPKEYKGKKGFLGKPKLILGLDIGDSSALLEAEKDKAAAAVAGGEATSQMAEEDFVSGTVLKRMEDHFLIILDDGRTAQLHETQLHDITSASKCMFNVGTFFSPKTRIEKAVIISNYKKDRMIQLTIKPLLLQAATVRSSTVSTLSQRFHANDPTAACFPKSISELSPGVVVVGYISKVESYGVVVKFRNGLSAMAPRSNIAEKFITSSVGMFEVGDSIRCVIQRIEIEKERVIISLNPNLVSPSLLGDITYATAILQNLYLLKLVENKETNLTMSTFVLGSVIEVQVLHEKEYGLVLLASNHLTMTLVRNEHKDEILSNKKGQKYVVGNTLSVRLLDFDFEHNIYDASLKNYLIKNDNQLSVKDDEMNEKKKNKKKNKTSNKLFIGLVVECIVELVKDKYLVVSCFGCVGYMMVADFHCPYKTTNDFNIGQTVRGRVEYLPSGSTLTTQNIFSYPHENQIIFRYIPEGQNIDNYRGTIARVQKEAEEADAKLLKIKNEFVAKDKHKILHEIQLGRQCKWIVKSITKTEIIVDYHDVQKVQQSGLAVRGVIHLSGAIDLTTGLNDLEVVLDQLSNMSKEERNVIHSKHPFYGISIGDTVSCTVQQMRYITNKKKQKNEDHENNNIEDDNNDTITKKDIHQVEELQVQLYLESKKSSKPDTRIPPIVQWMGRGAVQINTLYAAVVIGVNDMSCTIALSPYVLAQLSYLEVSNDYHVSKAFRDNCCVGIRLVVLVTGLHHEGAGKHSHVDVSRSRIEKLVLGSSSVTLNGRPIEVNTLQSEDKSLTEGDLVNGVIDLHFTKIPRPPAVMVLLSKWNTALL